MYGMLKIDIKYMFCWQASHSHFVAWPFLLTASKNLAAQCTHFYSTFTNPIFVFFNILLEKRKKMLTLMIFTRVQDVHARNLTSKAPIIMIQPPFCHHQALPCSSILFWEKWKAQQKDTHEYLSASSVYNTCHPHRDQKRALQER